MRSKGSIVAYESWQEQRPMPDVLLIMTKTMQDNYNVFGDIVMFDITYKVCSVSIPTSEGQDRYWNLGIFATTIEDLRPVICGVVFILEETEANFRSLFLMLH